MKLERINFHSFQSYLGDSVVPTTDGFETYGVTGVALITLAIPDPAIQAKLVVWIFGMCFLMDFLSGCAFFINKKIYKSEVRYNLILDPFRPCCDFFEKII